MGRLGVLKPLRGTESSLANVVLDEGELAFSYPSTGPGTGLGGIKMGDGTRTFSSLPWYITGEGSGPTPTPWEYNTGTDETALLNNIKHPEYETIGKIYYIYSYFSNNLEQNVPYIVIGINHDGTTNTMDLQSMVNVNNSVPWHNPYNSWTYGKYTNADFYSWIADTCPNGYSGSIKQKMCYMTERWREATGSSSGTLQTRQTKCKLLNPYEIHGSSISTYVETGYAAINDFTNYNYGEFYSTAFDNSTSTSSKRIRYLNKDLTSAQRWWTNSFWYEINAGTSNNAAQCYSINPEGDQKTRNIFASNLLCPVIRLSDTP